MAFSSISIGNTSTAKYIQGFTQHHYSQEFSSSVVFGKQPVYDELVELWEECKTPDWDGYEAIPIEAITYEYTYSVIEALPLGYLLPSLSVEPDGHIVLEWYRHPRWILSVSVSPEGYLYYAALFGNNKSQGSEAFLGEIPSTILNLIERVNLKEI